MARDPIKAAGITTYKAVHFSGYRDPEIIRYIGIHCTQAYPGLGSAMWFANPASSGSAHMIVDDDHSYKTLPDTAVPWAAPPINSTGWHIEFAGYAGWPKETWMTHKPMLDRGAYKIALRCHWYDIPVRQLGVLGLRLHRKGLVYHSTVSKAYGLSDHSDPGPGFPMAYVMDKAKFYLAELAVGV